MRTIKRVLLGVGTLVLVLVLTLVGLVVWAFWGNAPIPDAADLPGGARLVKDGMVAFFVLPLGGKSLALVDCGDDPEGKPILGELARRNATPDDVKAILLTHGHGDHTAGCHHFPNAEVMALAPDRALAAGTEASRGILPRFRKNGPAKAIRVTRVIEDDQTLQLGELSVRVFAIPGHTDGSAAFLAGGVLFLGDSAMCRKDGRLSGAPMPFTNDVGQNHASLRRLWKRLQDEKLEVKALAPAHSAPQEGIAGLEAFAKLGS